MKLRLLHTSDWHLGQTLHGFDRIYEHELFLDWLFQQIQEARPDLLLVSGDVFDSPNPSAQASRMYYRFLAKLASIQGLQVIIIAGNHDSASRLEAPRELLEALDITIRGMIQRNEHRDIVYSDLMIPLKAGGICLAVPYLRQGDYPAAETHSEGVRLLYQELINRLPQESQPTIAMGHLYAEGGQISEADFSERKIIGGEEGVFMNQLAQRLDYIALGHLHRAQKVHGLNNMRYSGSPIPMSFTEERYNQGVYLVEIEERETKVEQLRFQVPVRLHTIRGDKQSVLQLIALLDDVEELTAESPLLRVQVELNGPDPSLRFDLEQALKGKNARLALAEAILPERSETESKPLSTEELRNLNPIDVARAKYESVYGEMPDELIALLQEVISEIEEKERVI